LSTFGQVPVEAVNAHTAPVTVEAKRDTQVFDAVADPTAKESSATESTSPRRSRTQTQEFSTSAVQKRTTSQTMAAQPDPTQPAATEPEPATTEPEPATTEPAAQPVAAAEPDPAATANMAAADVTSEEEAAPADPGIVVPAETTQDGPADRAADPSEALALAIGSDRLSPQLALAALQASDDRDQIFEILLKGIRSRAAYAGLLTIKGKNAVGRMSLCASAFEVDDMSSVLIPIEGESPYKRAFESGAPFIGPLTSNDGAIDAMSARMGGMVPSAALLLPLSLRGRVVAIAVAHSGPKSRWVSRVGDLLPLAMATTDAISRILASKAKGKGKKKKGSSVPSPVDDLPTERVDTSDAPAPKTRRRKKKGKPVKVKVTFATEVDDSK
jgi:hypothetical protein